jgi:ketosteroid isomerase-like protein
VGSLATATFFGALIGSTVLLILLVVFALLATAYARSRPSRRSHGRAEVRWTGDTRWMSSANLDLVRSIYADWERGDWSSAEWAHPDIEYVIADGREPGNWIGLDAVASGNRERLGAWEAFGVQADEYRELDGERVLVLTSFSGHGETSGLELGPMGAEGAALFHVDDGKVTRLVAYADREHALTDLGLASEEYRDSG